MPPENKSLSSDLTVFSAVQAAYAFKTAANDQNGIMSAAGIARVSFVQMALIADFQHQRIERLQAFADQIDGRHYLNTALNGLISTSLYTPA